jgi:hypothetical protein
MKPDLAGAELGQLLDLGAEGADPVDEVLGAADHELEQRALRISRVDDAVQDDDAEHRGSYRLSTSSGLHGRVRGRRWAAGCGVTIASCTSSMPMPVLAVVRTGVVGGGRTWSSILLPDLVGGQASGKSTLLMTAHDLVVVLDRLVDVGNVCASTPLGGDDDERGSAPSAGRRGSG